MILIVEPILNQFCFFILFLNTLLSWIKVIFSSKKNIEIYSRFSMRISSLCLICLLIQRWIVSGHFPLSNLYESCIFLACSLSLVYHVIEKNIQNEWTATIIAPTNLLLQCFANFSLPISMQRATLLVPALQSNWLMMHVSMMIISYGFFILGSILSISFLFLYYNIKYFPIEKNISFDPENMEKILENLFIVPRQTILMNQLDYWSYRLIGIGFPCLTIGILSGAVWANEAWGEYWSWDPKETWAMITWIIFAIYLHTRMIKGWNGQKSAWVASAGLFVVWICYLGVNLLGKGLHSYGWLN